MVKDSPAISAVRPAPESADTYLPNSQSDYLPLCETYLPTFPIAIITISIQYARLFLRVPSVSSININQKVLMGPGGKKLLRDAQSAGRDVFVWTVNDEDLMRWSIEKKVSGVLTDDPELFRRVCDEWEEEKMPASSTLADGALVRQTTRKVRIPLMQRVKIMMVAVAAFVVSSLLMSIYRERIRRFVRDSRYYQ